MNATRGEMRDVSTCLHGAAHPWAKVRTRTKDSQKWRAGQVVCTVCLGTVGDPCTNAEDHGRGYSCDLCEPWFCIPRPRVVFQ